MLKDEVPQSSRGDARQLARKADIELLDLIRDLVSAYRYHPTLVTLGCRAHVEVKGRRG
jgi:hypothetical protein